MYPHNPNTYRPRRKSRLPYIGTCIGLAGLSLAIFGEEIFSDSQAQSEVPSNVKPAAEVTPIDPQNMQAIRDQYPRDEVYIKNINGINYAWPAGRPHRDLFKIALPCDVEAIDTASVQNGMISCHGDPFKDSSYRAGDNYAMDFVYRDAGSDQEAMVGEPVRAISDGQILDIKQDTRYADNCSSIQFQSVDGFVYYYGHLSNNQSVTDGQQVAAGQQIAEVGEAACGQGVAHLHLDRGMLGHRGGDDDFRDPGTIPILQDLYFSIPS